MKTTPNVDSPPSLEESMLNPFTQIEEKTKRLNLLSQLAQILNSTLNHSEVRRRAMEAAIQLMNAEVGSLLLIEEGRGQLYFEVAIGGQEEAMKKMTLRIGEGIAGWVAQHGIPLIVNHPETDPRFFKGADEKTEFKTRNIICAPVSIRERRIGVMEAINKKDGEGFNEEDLSLFIALSDQVAIALDNARLYQELEEMFFQTAESLAAAIEKRDPYTGGHTQRVTQYCLATAKYLSLTPIEIKWLKISAVLHDIGKIGIDDQILRKPDRLGPEEFDQIKEHAAKGAEILNPIKQLKEIIPGVKYHHEQIDGSGYPEGLKGDSIPLMAKIVAVADTYDAMTTERPYRKALSREMALRELKRCSGTQLDQRVVDAFVRAYEAGEI